MNRSGVSALVGTTALFKPVLNSELWPPALVSKVQLSTGVGEGMMGAGRGFSD